MRLLTINLLATAMLLLGALSANAWTITMQSSYAGATLAPSDTVSIDVYLDAPDTGLQLLSVAVVYDPIVLTYDGLSSTAASYILYAPAAGATPATYLVPSQNPPATWPVPDPGTGQVNVNFQEVNLLPTGGSGLGVYLATLVFHVADPGDGLGEIYLSLTSPGNIIRANDVVVTGSGILGPGIDVITPEPTTALLVGLGLIGLGVAGRRRA